MKDRVPRRYNIGTVRAGLVPIDTEVFVTSASASKWSNYRAIVVVIRPTAQPENPAVIVDVINEEKKVLSRRSIGGGTAVIKMGQVLS